MFFSKITNFIHYLLNKRSEIKDLRYKDMLMSKVILKIHKQKADKTIEMVPFQSILLLHRLDRENSLITVLKRIKALEYHKNELLNSKQLTKEKLQEIIPSVSAIKVVSSNNNQFIAFEGNGRIFAMQHVFNNIPDIFVEVEVYNLAKPEKIIKSLNRIRRINNLQ